MALVGNKADLHEKREVPTEVSLRKRLHLDSVAHFVVTFIVLASSVVSIFNFLTGWNGACREERHVLH
jgi:hypothetical protein